MNLNRRFGGGRAGRAAAWLLLIPFLAGCGAVGQEARRKAYSQFYDGDLDGALVALEDARDDKNRLLYAFDRGMIAHVRGDFEESNRAFAESEEIMEDLLTTDLSDEAASYLVNDYMLEYKGEDFERVLVHPIKALNYLSLGETEEALVECRALNNKLVELSEKYDEKSVYSEDAFARYLSGIIYESQGDLNEALVDYRLAAEAYGYYSDAYGTPVPYSLNESILRVAEANRIDHVFEAYRKKHPDLTWEPYREKRRRGEIVFVFENGQAPLKKEQDFHIGTGDQLISIAFPVFRAVPTEIRSATIRVGDRSAQAELAEDVTGIAIKDLEDRYGRVVLKELARATIKAVEVAKVRKKSAFWGFVLNMFNSANERADLRSWETLPGEFHIARLVVPPGSYESIELNLYGHYGGQIDSIDLGPLDIKAGETRFLYYRSLN